MSCVPEKSSTNLFLHHNSRGALFMGRISDKWRVHPTPNAHVHMPCYHALESRVTYRSDTPKKLVIVLASSASYQPTMAWISKSCPAIESRTLNSPNRSSCPWQPGYLVPKHTTPRNHGKKRIPRYRRVGRLRESDIGASVITQRLSKVHWTSRYAREIQDCYELSETHWYGGGETHTQVWPIETNPRVESPFVTGDFIQDPMINYGGVLEVLLACFSARDRPPYTPRSPLTLTYEWCVADNVREAHKLASRIFFSTPERSVDELMLVRPLWSTWAQFKEHVNSTIVVQFAHEIVDRGFANSSHIEIDDNWESCYGEEAFNTLKFPNPKAMVDEIKSLNLRVTAWVHPFVNYECPMFSEGLRNGYFVKDAKGQTGLSRWWQGANAGVIDVTNQHARFWWTERLEKLQKQTGLDSFKFDAGETFWLPGNPVLSGDDTLWPNVYSTKYVETCAKFGGLVETRVAHQTQKHGVFVRMLDKDSRWGHDNGLRSLIPTLLQFGIVGYPFVLPDMIGGNAYGGGVPSKQLYIRWMQANILFPAVQFSIVPWTFDDEVGVFIYTKFKRDITRTLSRMISCGLNPRLGRTIFQRLKLIPE
ncbi:hypothetical protein Ocin01_07359 [Orchesella cincta]|uniref:Glycoside hydrolase family 31 TIM barrel domain-containing protein n=1 Tax=Orchesella cincta TaxID=48709 RepID=A0A1D2N235_ORCCI|nr:hypothetical protein Ocin01_07359 [Orchesella cincta]